MSPANDVVWVDDLDDEVCWRLLAGEELGRVGFVLDGDPMVLPVNYVADGHSIVFRTGQSSLLEALGRGAPVAFEVDGHDGATATGWSVLVRGTGAEVDDEGARALARLPLEPWAPGRRDRWIRIEAKVVSGRAISRQRHEGTGDLLPYRPPG